MLYFLNGIDDNLSIGGPDNNVNPCNKILEFYHVRFKAGSLTRSLMMFWMTSWIFCPSEQLFFVTL